ncbi:type II toxin-antitoxin system RelE/ParE family toxin [uncultured Polaribacter sp.]|uniref:type II toxin-antitoxin system RelE/ParE family toxin n=1 Tax=uncultured Polaribacter sp. TaxID=174711 RepID=UPI00260882AE|nr:type II toxin-antitoxin system RelE/ParE family toxin [uncultured Polaribacter sp.]
MNKNFDTIIWSSDSENDLDDIEEYYTSVSPEKSTQKIIDIILKVEETIFSEQWQIDEFDSSSRRMIINKKFRVLYKIIDKNIIITRVYPTQKNPENIS